MTLTRELICEKAMALALVPAAEQTPDYDPAIYQRFFDDLLQHRNTRHLQSTCSTPAHPPLMI